MSFIGLELILLLAQVHEQGRPRWRRVSGALDGPSYKNLPGIIFNMWINIFDFCQDATWWSFISFLMSDAYRSPVICPFPYLSDRFYHFVILEKIYFDTNIKLFENHRKWTIFTQFWTYLQHIYPHLHNLHNFTRHF